MSFQGFIYNFGGVYYMMKILSTAIFVCINMTCNVFL